MKQQWTRKTYLIIMGEMLTLGNQRPQDGWVQVDGIVLSDSPELGLHVGVTQQIDVTHIPTGKRIGGFDTLGAAMEFAHRVAYLRDWSTDAVTPEECTAITNLHTTLAATAVRPRRVYP
jgi:hypothetical protein